MRPALLNFCLLRYPIACLCACRAIHKTTLIARPPRDILAIFVVHVFTAFPYMVSIALSAKPAAQKVRRGAIRAAFTAGTALIALRSIQGFVPDPPPGLGEQGLLHANFPPQYRPAGLPPAVLIRPRRRHPNATPTSLYPLPAPDIGRSSCTTCQSPPPTADSGR